MNLTPWTEITANQPHPSFPAARQQSVFGRFQVPVAILGALIALANCTFAVDHIIQHGANFERVVTGILAVHIVIVCVGLYFARYTYFITPTGIIRRFNDSYEFAPRQSIAKLEIRPARWGTSHVIFRYPSGLYCKIRVDSEWAKRAQRWYDDSRPEHRPTHEKPRGAQHANAAA